MKHRNLAVVVILTLVTLGLYGIYWEVVTARELRKLGANIPNSILIIIPIASYYWLWRYSAGVESVTRGKWSAPLIFFLFFLTGIGGIILGQLAFNEDVSADGAAGAAGAPPAPAADPAAAAGPATLGAAAGIAQQPAQSTSDINQPFNPPQDVTGADISPSPAAGAPDISPVSSSPDGGSSDPLSPPEIASAPDTLPPPPVSSDGDQPDSSGFGSSDSGSPSTDGSDSAGFDTDQSAGSPDDSISQPDNSSAGESVEVQLPPAGDNTQGTTTPTV